MEQGIDIKMEVSATGPFCRGTGRSVPSHPVDYVAKWIRHLTTNQRTTGSNSARDNKSFVNILFLDATVDACISRNTIFTDSLPDSLTALSSWQGRLDRLDGLDGLDRLDRLDKLDKGTTD